MSCTTCIYSVGKEATCNMTYACNTDGDKPTEREEKQNKKSNRKK